jgi:chromosome segregation ATPase
VRSPERFESASQDWIDGGHLPQHPPAVVRLIGRVDMEKLLDEYAHYAALNAMKWTEGEYAQEELASRAAIIAHVAELRERAESWERRVVRSETEAKTLRDECAQISEEFGLPPTIRPAEGEIRRMVERARRTEKAEAKLERVRESLNGARHDIASTRAWRSTRGMKVATDTTRFAAVSESGLQAIERLCRDALGAE